ncbi:MAG: ABC transporter permease [Candidatus Spyradocola sp.]|jgi:putative aldouronate transport system permease protein
MAAKSALTPGTAKTLKHKKWGSGEVKRHLAFLTMLLPGLVFLFCFSYLPMPALILAFKRYQLATPPADYWIQNRFIYSLFVDNEWVGFSNFEYIFNTPDAAMVLRNTLGYNIVFMALGLVLSVALAIMVNELRNRILAKVYHTILFMPYFISWIIVAYVVYAFVSANGVFNQWLKALGQNTINFYSSPQYWPFIFVFCNIWKYTGNNSIIYLATLTGFDQELYEAAAIDGAGKWKQITNITLPLLLPTIVLLEILAVGRIFNGDFDMFYSVPNGSGPLKNVSTTLDVYVYNTMKTGAQLGLASAAAFFQSIVGFIMVLSTNLIVRKVSPEMAMF